MEFSRIYRINVEEISSKLKESSENKHLKQELTDKNRLENSELRNKKPEKFESPLI